ncbi:MAG: hypothetical protein ACI9OJ_001500 [Myxococcota bacterium]|jgi:hypothetical protein
MQGSANDQRIRSLAALTDLLARTADSDVVAIRSARLAELSKERRAWLSESAEALELLLESWAARQGAIDRGEVTAPAVEPVVTETIDDTTEDLRALTEASEATGAAEANTATEIDAIDIEDDHPTGEVAAVETERAAGTQVSVERIDAPNDVQEPDNVQPDESSEMPTVLEMPALTDSDIEAHLASQGAGPPRIPTPSPNPAASPGPPEIPPVGVAVHDDKPAWVTAVEEHNMTEAETMDSITPGWTRPAELLFEDTLRLFRLGDSDGALISLERLLASMELNDDLREFVRVNEERLLQLYHAVLGPWTRIPKRHTPKGFHMPKAFFEARKVGIVLGKITDTNSIGDIMEGGEMSRLEAVATLSQLVRARAVVMEEA